MSTNHSADPERVSTTPLTPSEYARRWGYHVSTVRRWIRDGMLPPGVSRLERRSPEGCRKPRFVLHVET